MQNGWVKFHRKLLDNELLKYDISAYVVFTRLLLVADRKTGSYTTGRFMLAELTGLKPTTAYNALKRLEKAKMLNVASNNKYSKIHICNWSTYQSLDDNKMTSSRQQNDTKQELRNKNIYKKDFQKGTYPAQELKPEHLVDKRGEPSKAKERIREFLQQGKDFKQIAKELKPSK